MMPLYHYSSTMDTGQPTTDDVVIFPEAETGLVWLTDMQVPMRRALMLPDGPCLRAEVLDMSSVEKWTTYRGKREDLVFDLELQAGAAPNHWWVSEQPVRATFARETA